MASTRLASATFGPVEQPRYVQLARLMRADIDRGVLQVGDRLPGEREICRRFEVSRTTVRRALEDLQSQGYVHADRTRGWFVTALVEPNQLVGFTDLADRQGLDATSRVLRCEVREATLAEVDDLQAPPGADVLELERVRLMGGVPVGWQRAVAAAWLAPCIGGHDYRSASLFRSFRDDGITPTRADYDVRAGSTDPDQGALLEVAPGTPLLLIRATILDQEGRRVEVSDGAFLGERYRFRASVTAGTAGTAALDTGPR
jgi:GntR family transcriptional regulator